MVDVTRLNGKEITINADIIEKIEESPDTMITLTNGNRILVRESREQLKQLVIDYKLKIFKNFT